MVHSLIYLQSILLPFFDEMWISDRFSSDTWTHVLRRVFPTKALREFLEETQQ